MYDSNESSLQGMDSKYKASCERNKYLISLVYDKEKLVKDTYFHLLKFDPKMTSMIHSTYINTLNLSNQSSKRVDDLVFKNRDKSMEYLGKIKEWNVNECMIII